MKVCFDTSTLVAALIQQHPHHSLAFPHLKKVHQGAVKGCLTTHGLAELFATLTALPLKPRLSPTDAQQLIEKSVLSYFTVIPLDVGSYEEALRLVVAQNLASGAVYDALHLTGARAMNCNTLLTLNLRHFRALAPGDALVASP